MRNYIILDERDGYRGSFDTYQEAEQEAIELASDTIGGFHFYIFENQRVVVAEKPKVTVSRFNASSDKQEA